MAGYLDALQYGNNYGLDFVSNTEEHFEETAQVYRENSAILHESTHQTFGEETVNLYEGESTTPFYMENSGSMFGEESSNYITYGCYNCKSTSLDYCVCMRMVDPEDEDLLVMAKNSNKTTDRNSDKTDITSKSVTERMIKDDSYCADCGATWSSCICLGCLDPEDETEMQTEVPVANTNMIEGSGCQIGKGFEHSTITRKTAMEDDLFQNKPSALSDLSILQSQLNEIKQNCSVAKQNLAMSCVTFLHDLKSFRKKFNSHLDNLEKEAKLDLNNLYETLDRDINEDLNSCKNTAHQAEELVKHLEKTVVDTFDIKKYSRQIANLRILADKVATSDNTGKFEFAFHPKLKNLLNEVKSMGQIIHTHPEIQDPAEVHGVDVDIRASNDTKSACITGICQMKNGHMLIADRDNQNLKYLNTDYQIIGQCPLNAAPRSVCCINDSEVAVALSTNTIQIVSIGKSMTVLRSLALDHQCWGIACYDNKLYISDWGERVYMYSTSGTLIKIVHKDTNGYNIFTNTRHIAINEKLHHVYVCDRTKGLVTLNERGQVVSTANHDSMKLPCGVCVAPSGHVYMSGSLTHNIVQVQKSCTGLKQTPDKGDNREILTKSDGVTHPGAICYDNLQGNLIVASFPPFGGCDKLRVFNMA